MEMYEKFNWQRCFKYASRIWENDRLLSNSAFLRTAEYIETEMRNIGLEEVEVLNAKADARTMYAEWIIPRAWEIRSARLSYEDGEIIADYDEIPCSVSMRSAKTPKEGLVLEAVDADKQEAGEWMRGKLLFSSKPASMLSDTALKYGASGIITDYFPLYEGIRESAEDVSGAARWDCEFMGNTNNTSLFAFNLTPERGEQLRKRLAAGEKINLRAFVDSEEFDGFAPTISGAIKGTDPSLGEIFLYAHLYEPGANDNASGCAVLMEVMNMYLSAIRDGTLQSPKRTIRLALGQECMGSNAYLIHHPERDERICLDADMIGTEKIDNAILGICHSPYSNWSFLDDLIEETVQTAQTFAPFPYHSRPFSISSDNMLADPYFKMPTVALITAPAKSYHSSMDTPDRLEEGVMRRNAWIFFTMLQKLSMASEETPVSLTFAFTKKKLAEAKNPLEREFWRAKAEHIRAELASFSKGEIPPAFETAFSFPKPPAGIPPLRAVRIIDGCMTLPKTDPETGKTFYPAWNKTPHLPLFWINGKRTVWEIACLTAMEEGNNDYERAYEECLSLFRALDKCGNVNLESI